MYQRLAAEPGQPVKGNYRFKHPDGTIRWHDVVVTNLLDDPDVRALVVNHRDITESHETRRKLEHDASHDSLTGLANRAAFLRALERETIRSANSTGYLAVLYVDLDSFKPINDTMGHHAGDTVLIAVAAAVRSAVLGSDLVARLGGDEFAVLLTHLEQPEDALHVSRRVSAAISSPVEVGGRILMPRASIGVATSDSATADATELLRCSDMAMYQAKRNNERWRLYRPDVDSHHGGRPGGDDPAYEIHSGPAGVLVEPPGSPL